MGSEAIVFYLPVLIVSGVFTGVVIRSGIRYSCKACQESSKLRLILTARKKSIK